MKTRITTALIAGWLLSGLSAAEAPRQTPGGVRASHREVQPIGADGDAKMGRLTTLCTTPDDRLLACDGRAKVVKVFDLKGQLQATWPLPFAPSAVCAAADGTIYVGGVAKLAKLDGKGKLLKTADVEAELVVSRAGRSDPRRRARFGRRPVGKASGMAATAKELFVSFGAGWSLRSKDVIVRFDRDLGRGKQIASGLNGCCQRLDLTAIDGVLYVAENTRYRVLRMDREGKVLGQWGKRDRRDIAAFGSCCNPMNLCVGPGKVIYTAESGLGRVKRYTPEGRFLGLVGEIGVTRFTRAGGLAASCSNIAVAASADGGRVFVQDVKTNAIRVLVADK